MRTRDFAFAVRLANTMDWHMTPEDFAFNRKLEPNGCFVLSADGKLAGVATCISYGRVGWFGNLIVDEEYRQQGAATELLKNAVNYLESKGAETIGLYAYKHLQGFYSKAQFRADADFAVLRADAVSSVGSSGIFEKVTEERFPRIVRLDSRCFGGARAKLLKEIAKGRQNPFYVAVEGDKVIGYAAAKLYGISAEVGPLVCQSDRLATAVALLKTILSNLAGLEAYMYLPKAQTALLQVTSEVGFSTQFELVRMFLGSTVAQDCVYMAESLERG